MGCRGGRTPSQDSAIGGRGGIFLGTRGGLCHNSSRIVQRQGMAGASAAIGGRFEPLLESLWDPEIGPAALSPSRFIKLLGIDLQTLARQAHVHRNTLGRSPSSEKVQQYLRDALRVIRAAADTAGVFTKQFSGFATNLCSHLVIKLQRH